MGTEKSKADNLEQRLRTLEAKDEIRELRAEYCFRADDRDWEGWADTFTEDGRIEVDQLGTYEGRDEIIQFGTDVIAGEYQWFSHMVHNGVIDVDGDEATGKWYFEVPCVSKATLLNEGEAGWLQGRYDEEYRRVDGEWKISVSKAAFHYVADYEEGWGEQILEGISE
ncbi:nuclear transport factor 2 family protein [Natrinema caseinilyticum]|uniref:nuclear transport factor 2 family protein n=1 Tax=Natrinema caseinilyticum TaxID=2961570 RepID=UPI0020C51B07|nr:nuclear transport factor 2 family protein [Natrinema caseinilyticum]